MLLHLSIPNRCAILLSNNAIPVDTYDCLIMALIITYNLIISILHCHTGDTQVKIQHVVMKRVFCNKWQKNKAMSLSSDWHFEQG